MALSVGLVASAFAQHPQAQPKPKLSDIKTIPIPGGFRVETAEGFFPPGNSVTDPPGTNFLPTVYENYRLPNGMELRSEEHTSELQSLMRISYAVFCLQTKKHSNST